MGHSSVNLATRYQLLNAMGVSQWLSKAPHSSSFLLSETPLFCAPCLVILPEKIPQAEVEQNKIFIGMLKVLMLSPEELAIVWVRNGLLMNQYPYVGLEIAKWAPCHILIMGEKLSQNILGTEQTFDQLRIDFQRIVGVEGLVQVTYHPAELQKAPEHKGKAYRDLLRLKEKLLTVREP